MYADRIAMCQAPDGPHEHVPLSDGEDPGRCFMDCDCTLRVYVALDAVVEALQAPNAPVAAEGQYGGDAWDAAAEFIDRKFGGAALKQDRGPA